MVSAILTSLKMERLDRINTRTGRILFLVELMPLIPLLILKFTDGYGCCEGGKTEGGEKNDSDGTSEGQSVTSGGIFFYCCSISTASEPPSYSYWRATGGVFLGASCYA